MADDIVTRLRKEHPLQYGYLNGHVAENTECNDDPQITDRVNRCWKCQQWSPCDVREAADEIQLLRAALALACGLLSTYEDHAMFQPDQLMQQFIKEARRG